MGFLYIYSYHPLLFHQTTKQVNVKSPKVLSLFDFQHFFRSKEKMSVEILDGATIINFIEDEAAFTISVSERFAYLDTDHDGILSYAEMLRELQSLRVFEIHFGNDVKPEPDELARVYTSLFLQFDHDCNGAVDLEEYKAETKNMMLAMANGMGFLPVQMVLEQNSLLKKAVERESTKVAA